MFGHEARLASGLAGIQQHRFINSSLQGSGVCGVRLGLRRAAPHRPLAHGGGECDARTPFGCQLRLGQGGLPFGRLVGNRGKVVEPDDLQFWRDERPQDEPSVEHHVHQRHLLVRTA